MSHVFTLGDMDDFAEKINLDELYEKKKKSDLIQLNTFNKILNRIHQRIKHISRQRCDQYCFFIVPEVMIGIPKYNNADCIAYLINKLKKNGFIVKYTHPNMLFISWKNWIPDYVRQEIKKQTNVVVDGYGNIVSEKEENDKLPTNRSIKKDSNKKNNNFKSIEAYKPTGNSIYSDDLLK